MSEVTTDDVERRSLVLVVEDEVFIAMELEQALTAGGFHVQGPASSVRDALELLEEERPYAAVLDFNLGREKVTPVALKLQSLGIPFVLASATAATELAHYDVLAGVTNVGKPTNLHRLVEAVRALNS
ncbi:response regulator (plasmid) [Rhizobium acidisoli]|uniref:Response regulator n=1 Tax=Rhizobium acidisoli TaxID=1538158 RepID=A0AAE6C5Z2_9HYPH|nr:response regulator [Rhizobium acidisoli]KPH05088.1 chemotaxis protein CheY [Rhizobium acidisoli]QAS83176.1 response regulator [Rhizobium acidisoli]